MDTNTLTQFIVTTTTYEEGDSFPSTRDRYAFAQGPVYEGIWEARATRNKNRVITVTGRCPDNKVTFECSDGSEEEMLLDSLLMHYKLVVPAKKAPPCRAPAPRAILASCKPEVASTPACEVLGPERSALRLLLTQNRRDGESITTIQSFLTPALALELLTVNPCNRILGTARAKVMARDMLAGHWAKSDQGLALNPDLEIGNGQHRCTAVLLASESDPDFQGVPVAFSWYHDHTEFETARKIWDSGTKRSRGGSLEITGKVRKGLGTQVAAIIQGMSYIDARVSSQTISEIEGIYFERQDAINAVAKLNKKEFQAPVKAAFAIAHMKNPKAIDEAIKLVSTKVGYTKGSAAHALVLKIPALQRNHDRTQVIQDVLALLYQHVKGEVCSRSKACNFFLGNHYRPLASK